MWGAISFHYLFHHKLYVSYRGPGTSVAGFCWFKKFCYVSILEITLEWSEQRLNNSVFKVLNIYTVA